MSETKKLLENMNSNLNEENDSNEYNYMLLDRLKQDCDYFLGNGNRNPKYLWAGSVDDQIAKMKELWNSFPDGEKPEWLSMEDIEDYENEMTDTTKGPEARKTIQDTLDRNWNKVNKIGIEESNINDMNLEEMSREYSEMCENAGMTIYEVLDNLIKYDVIKTGSFRLMLQELRSYIEDNK